MAYGVSLSGSEDAVPHVVETATARETGDVIDRTQFGSVSWMLDGRSFLYNRLQKMEPQSPPTDRYLKSRIYLHVLGKEPEADRAFLGIGLSPKVQMTDADAAFVQTVAGSDYVFVWVSSGQNEVALYATSLHDSDKPVIPHGSVRTELTPAEPPNIPEF